MLLKSFKTAVVVLLQFLVVACSTSKQASKTKTDNTLDKPLNTNNSIMWQISGNNLSQPSYLFGTIHAIPAKDYFLGKNVEKKLKSVDQLVLEMDLDKVNLAKLSQLSLLPNDVSIFDFVSQENYNKALTFAVDSLGVNEYTFENAYAKMKPFYLEQMVMMSMIGNDKMMYEDELMHIVKDKHIPILGLETLDEQLGLIDSIPLQEQYDAFIESIVHYDKQLKQYNDLVEAYKEQNLDKLLKMFDLEYGNDNAAYKSILIDQRNANWLDKITTLISDKSSFIAVGAG
ncbi:MAG: TraB/GumN family protein, partial [Chitinophagales bacterium]